MSRAKRLAIVLELAERTEQQAAQASELARRLWQDDQQKLDNLCEYYTDYEVSFARPGAFARAEDIARQRGFLSQLADAKQQQSAVVEKRWAICHNKQQAWQQTRLKRKALQELIQRLQADEARAVSRQEAKMLDEWFSQTKSHRQERQTDQ